MSVGIYLLIIMFVNMNFFFFLFWFFLCQSSLKSLETNFILAKLIITFGFFMPSTTLKFKEMSDSLYSLY